MATKITISDIKADIGGFVGHSSMHPDIMELANDELKKAKGNKIVDFFVARVGDDLHLIMTHNKGVDSPQIHGLAWEILEKCSQLAEQLKLYGAGQDLLVEAFSGNVRGMGPGVAEMEITERRSEPIVVFMADKTSPGCWNYPLYKIFADPFNSPGLVIDPKMSKGFIFRVYAPRENRYIDLQTPEESYILLGFLGAPNDYIVDHVRPKDTDEPCAVASTSKLALIAGRYVGKDDPVLIVRCQSGLPAVGEVTEPFANPWIVPGWMRGSHFGPIMPVPMRLANPVRFDGPPRVVALGFQLADGMLGTPADLFDDPAFDDARDQATRIANILRRHGPFEPHRLPLEEMEYTTMPGLMEKLAGRWHESEKQQLTPEQLKEATGLEMD